MTTQEIVSVICAKMQKTDTTSQARCLDFVKRRWDMVWSHRLWRRSLLLLTVSVSAEQEDVTMPVTVGLVAGLRWSGGTPLDPTTQESILFQNPTLFERIGMPAQFLQLPRTGAGECVVRLLPKPQTADNLLVLAKKPLPDISADTAQPSLYLDACDNTLIALAEADMLERQQQWSAAGLKRQEALAHLKIMADQEEKQSAHMPQLTPTGFSIDVGDW